MSCVKDTNNWTCFSKKSLVSLIESYNTHMSPSSPLTKSGSKRELWSSISNMMVSVCNKDDETCWVDKLHNSIADKDLKPKAPSYWEVEGFEATRASTLTYVLQRYEQNYKNFRYLGTFPMDFQQRKFGSCVGKFMCDFSIIPYAQRKMCFGMILNTHTSEMPGEHWVAIFCETDPSKPSYGIHYYDSYAENPPPRASKFMQIVLRQMRIFNKQIQFKTRQFTKSQNTHQHQYLNQNCGIFCTAMIIACASGMDFEEYCASSNINDKSIEAYRKEAFRFTKN